VRILVVENLNSRGIPEFCKFSFQLHPRDHFCAQTTLFIQHCLQCFWFRVICLTLPWLPTQYCFCFHLYCVAQLGRNRLPMHIRISDAVTWSEETTTKRFLPGLSALTFGAFLGTPRTDGPAFRCDTATSTVPSHQFEDNKFPHRFLCIKG